MGVRIAGMHYCLPDARLTQEELERRFNEKQVRSIAKMSGIRERRVASPGQTASDFAFAAAEGLLRGLEIDRRSIDAVILCTQMPDYQIPATACILQHRLGLGDHCAAFDINQGCAAFPYGLSVARAYIASGMMRRVLLLNADVLSPLVHPMDRGLVTLHGDGACATLLEAQDGPGGVEFVELGSDGSGWEYIHVPVSGARMRRDGNPEHKVEIVDESGSVRTAETLAMNGPAVFQFSIGKVPDAIRAALGKHAVDVADVGMLLLHQANRMMLDLIYKKLGVPESGRFHFSETVGNLGGSSSAVLLAEALRQGKIASGSRTVVAAFGNGLSWGIAGIRWTGDMPAIPRMPVDWGELTAALGVSQPAKISNV